MASRIAEHPIPRSWLGAERDRICLSACLQYSYYRSNNRPIHRGHLPNLLRKRDLGCDRPPKRRCSVWEWVSDHFPGGVSFLLQDWSVKNRAIPVFSLSVRQTVAVRPLAYIMTFPIPPLKK